MNPTRSTSSRLDSLVDSFMERQRRGEHPSIEEYVRENPDLADDIRELFPTLEMIEAFASAPGVETAPRLNTDTEFAAPPTQLGEFRIVREIGQGGMGVVYEAVQESLGRHVALKVMPTHAQSNPVFVERFRREAQSAAKLHHTNIVPVFGVGEHDGVSFYAMQFIKGQSLEAVLQELRALRHATPATARPAPTVELSAITTGMLTGRFEVDQAIETEKIRASVSAPSSGSQLTVRSGDRQETLDPSRSSQTQYFRNVAGIALQVADGLAYAHAQGVIHRDIKPSNLLLDLAGTVWITDFGLAKAQDSGDLTSPGDILGTLRYMSPEQLTGVADARSDVYSLGITLYELVTMKPAFDDPVKARLIDYIRQHEPSAPHRLEPNVPRDLETIILKAIAKEPAQRYQSATELADDLRRYLADRPIHARRTSWLEHGWRWCRRNRMLASLAAGVLLLIGVVIPVLQFAHSMNLEDKLKEVAKAQKEEETAKRDALEKLAISYLEQARSKRTSRQIGHRFDALVAVKKAVQHTHELDLPADRLKERLRDLRNEAIAALALPDLEVLHHRTFPPREAFSHASERFDVYARGVHQGGPGDGISIQRVDTGAEVGFLEGSSHINYMFSPDNRFLAAKSGSMPWEITVWEIGRKQAIRKLPVSDFAYGFSPDGRSLAVGHEDGRVDCFDVSTWEIKQSFHTGAAPGFVIYDPHGTQLAVTVGNTVRIFDLASGKTKSELRHSANVFRVAWRFDGKRIATTDMLNDYHTWDVHGQRHLLQNKTRLVGPLNLCYNATGECVFVSGFDGRMSMWDAETGRLILSAPNEAYLYNHPRENLVGLCTTLTSLGVWRVEPARVYRTLDDHNRTLGHDTATLAIHPNGRFVAAGLYDHVALYDIAMETKLGRLSLQRPTPFFESDGTLLTASLEGLQRWPLEPETGKAARFRLGKPVLELSQPAAYADVSADRKMIALTDYKTLVVHQRGDSGGPVVLPAQEGVNAISNPTLSPDGRWLAAKVGGPFRIHVWDVAGQRLVKEIPLGGIVWATARFSPDNRWLGVAGGLHRTFDSKTWEPGPSHGTARLEAGTFAPDSRIVAVERGDGVVALCDVESGWEHARLTDPNGHQAHAMAFTPDGSKLVTANKSNIAIHVWDLRLLRTELAKLGLDWEAPPYGPAPSKVVGALELVTPETSTPPKVPTSIERERDTHFARGKVRFDKAMSASVLNKDEFRAAIEDFSAALKLDPAYVEAYHYRSHSHASSGNLGAALVDVNKAMELKPNHAHFYDMRGGFQFRRQEYAEAVASFHRVLELGKEVTQASYRLAWIYLAGPEKLRDDKQGLTMAQRAISEKKAPLADCLTLLGVAQLRRGAPDKAVEHLKQLAKLEKGASTGVYLLAQSVSHYHAGNAEQGRQDYDRAVAWRKLQTKLSHEHAGLFEALRAEAASLQGINISKMKP